MRPHTSSKALAKKLEVRLIVISRAGDFLDARMLPTREPRALAPAIPLEPTKTIASQFRITSASQDALAAYRGTKEPKATLTLDTSPALGYALGKQSTSNRCADRSYLVGKTGSVKTGALCPRKYRNTRR
jgi:hypothetical protein